VPHRIISNTNVPNIYYVPNLFLEQHVNDYVCDTLLLTKVSIPSTGYTSPSHIDMPTFKVLIAGKYTGVQDTYLSLVRAIEHAMFFTKCKIDIEIHDCDDADIPLDMYQGVIIPGGFGSRGIDGKLKIAQYCRERGVPMLGICLGLQVMVCEFARNVCHMTHATSEEWNEVGTNVICMLAGQSDQKGGTLRLGNYTTVLKPDTTVFSLYGKTEIIERHRHRYEVNPIYVDQIQENGLHFVGQDKYSGVKEIVELIDHPFYVGCQYHPEFRSTLQHSHPLFLGWVQSLGKKHSTANSKVFFPCIQKKIQKNYKAGKKNYDYVEFGKDNGFIHPYSNGS